jgi:hypothetical protein
VRFAALLALLACALVARADAATPTLPPGVTLPPGTTPVEGPKELVSTVFEIEFRATGTYWLQYSDSSGGSWRVDAQPQWVSTYKQIAFPHKPTSQPVRSNQPDLTKSGGAFGGWTNAGQVSEMRPPPGPDPFSCSGPLQLEEDSLTGGRTYAVVRVSGKQFDLELPSAAQIGALSVACNPVEASGFTAWSGDLGSLGSAFVKIPIDDIESENSLKFPVSADRNRGKIGSCRSPGACSHDLTWSGTVQLRKVCRNLAGVESEFTTGTVSVPTVSCESDCEADGCSREDVTLEPLRKPLKASSKGQVSLPINCFGDSSCSGAATITAGASGAGAVAAGKATLGKSKFRVKPGVERKVKVQLSKRGKSLLRRAGVLSGRVTLRMRGKVAKKKRSGPISIRR